MWAWFILKGLPYIMHMNQISTKWQHNDLTFTLANSILTNRASLVVICSQTLQVAPSFFQRATKQWEEISSRANIVNICIRTLQVDPSFRRRATKRWDDIGLGASLVVICTRTLKFTPSYHQRATKRLVSSLACAWITVLNFVHNDFSRHTKPIIITPSYRWRATYKGFASLWSASSLSHSGRDFHSGRGFLAVMLII